MIMVSTAHAQHNAPWRPSRRALRRYATGYLFLLPAFVSLVIVCFLPMFQGITTSFQNFNLFRPGHREFVGLDQFWQMANDPIFMRAFWQSWYFALGSVFFQCVLGMAAALLLNQDIRFRGFFRGLVLIPATPVQRRTTAQVKRRIEPARSCRPAAKFLG